MRIENPVQEARLLRRYKRFLADVELDGETLTVHCPNPGAMLGCQEPGSRVIVRDSLNPKRKLLYTFQAIEVAGEWVNVDTSLANPLVAESVEAGRIPELAGYAELRREVAFGDSRIDLFLDDPERAGCFVEVKSTTLVEDRDALFPDAPTERGRKHLVELERAARAGHRAVIFFLVARHDVDAFRPADRIDPEYGELLRRVTANGVEALCYTTRVHPDRLELGKPVPVRL